MNHGQSGVRLRQNGFLNLENRNTGRERDVQGRLVAPAPGVTALGHIPITGCHLTYGHVKRHQPYNYNTRSPSLRPTNSDDYVGILYVSEEEHQRTEFSLLPALVMVNYY
jgi:hypothetical protein